MKKLLFLLLIVFSSIVSFAQVRAKVVLGSQPPHHRHYVHRHYVQHRRYVRHRRHYYHHRSGVVLKAKL